VSKWPWLKVFAGFSAVIFMVSLGYWITDHKTAVSPSAHLSEVLPAVESGAIVKNKRLQDPGAALIWLLEALSTSEPELTVTESSRVMYNGRLSWKRAILKGISGDIEGMAAVLEASRKSLIQEFNYQLLLNSEPGRGNLSFLLIDGFEVVVVANFAVAGVKPAPKPESRLPQLAIVIDDLGRSLESAADFAALDIPLTFAVFPKPVDSSENIN
jgi:hypothetical protein